MTEHSTPAVLAQAASLLRNAGVATLAAGNGESGTRCLRAAGLLEPAGARLAFLDAPRDPAAAVRRALHLLAQLPEELFATTAVLDAAADAQAALRKLG